MAKKKTPSAKSKTAAGSKASQPASRSPLIDRDLIHELAALLDETGLTEIEIDPQGKRIRVARMPAAVAAAAPVMAAGGSRPAPAAAAPVGESSSKPLDPAKHPGVVVSPMVGTAYAGPAPGARPYVEVGAKVKEGQTLLIIEAMKTMNQIPAGRDGTVIQILFEDGQPIEFGQPLLIVE